MTLKTNNQVTGKRGSQQFFIIICLHCQNMILPHLMLMKDLNTENRKPIFHYIRAALTGHTVLFQ
jgi:hypothetical protein